MILCKRKLLLAQELLWFANKINAHHKYLLTNDVSHIKTAAALAPTLIKNNTFNRQD